MAYVLEWQAGIDSDPRSLIRHVRVFRDAGGLKAFLRSRAFQRLAGPELRIEYRPRGRRPHAVITTCAAALGWDAGASRLPPPLVRSAWSETLSAMALRAQFTQRVVEVLRAGVEMQLLREEDFDLLAATLREILARHAAPPPAI